MQVIGYILSWRSHSFVYKLPLSSLCKLIWSTEHIKCFSGIFCGGRVYLCNIWDCVFSIYQLFMCVRICVLHLCIIIQSGISMISHCLRLGRKTKGRACYFLGLAIFLGLLLDIRRHHKGSIEFDGSGPSFTRVVARSTCRCSESKAFLELACSVLWAWRQSPKIYHLQPLYLKTRRHTMIANLQTIFLNAFFFMKVVPFSFQFHLSFKPKGPTGNKSALVHLMVWCR